VSLEKGSLDVMWREGRAVYGVLCALLLGSLAPGCASGPPPPPEVCLSIEASANLNVFDGEPHVVVVYFYPLRNEMAFRQADAAELLDGQRSPGMTGDVWETTVLPGEYRKLRESLPRDTQFLGILADFYSGPSQTTVKADCPRFGKPHVVLSASDVQAK
jgi:type VI secretion system VasD/TssJ family lipoprotein